MKTVLKKANLQIDSMRREPIQLEEYYFLNKRHDISPKKKCIVVQIWPGSYDD